MPRWVIDAVTYRYMDGDKLLGTVILEKDGRWFWHRYEPNSDMGYTLTRKDALGNVESEGA